MSQAIITLVAVVVGFLLSQVAEIIKSELQRDNILKALHAQVYSLLPKVHLRNKTATDQGEKEHLLPIFYPTSSLESAFLSANGISSDVGTIQATIEYLDKAHDLNSQIRILRDTFYMPRSKNAPGSRELAKKYLYDQVHDETNDFSMFRIIDELKEQIDQEQRQSFWKRLV